MPTFVPPNILKPEATAMPDQPPLDTDPCDMDPLEANGLRALGEQIMAICNQEGMSVVVGIETADSLCYFSGLRGNAHPHLRLAATLLESGVESMLFTLALMRGQIASPQPRSAAPGAETIDAEFEPQETTDGE